MSYAAYAAKIARQARIEVAAEEAAKAAKADRMKAKRKEMQPMYAKIDADMMQDIRENGMANVNLSKYQAQVEELDAIVKTA